MHRCLMSTAFLKGIGGEPLPREVYRLVRIEKLGCILLIDWQCRSNARTLPARRRRFGCSISPRLWRRSRSIHQSLLQPRHCQQSSLWVGISHTVVTLGLFDVLIAFFARRTSYGRDQDVMVANEYRSGDLYGDRYNNIYDKDVRLPLSSYDERGIYPSVHKQHDWERNNIIVNSNPAQRKNSLTYHPSIKDIEQGIVVRRRWMIFTSRARMNFTTALTIMTDRNEYLFE